MEAAIIPVVALVIGLGLGYVAAMKIKAAGASRPDAELENQRAIFDIQLRNLEMQLNDADQKIEEARNRAETANSEKAALAARKEQLEQDVIEFGRHREEMTNDMKIRFENLANEALKRNTEQLKTSSGEVLKPLGISIDQFRSRVEDFNSAQDKLAYMLNSELQKMMQTSMTLGDKADGLAKTLRGDVKKQGNWGELKLEKIFEASDLVEGREYKLQGRGLGLKSEDGRTQLPDAILLLPDKRHLVIDSKVSLVAFDNYCNTENPDELKFHLSALINSVAQHVNGLSAKNYQKLEGLNTPDYVIMFMPSEMAFQLVMAEAQNVILDAWKKKIVIATPSNLMSTLKTASSLWAMENRNKNADLIARDAGLLYDKFVGFLEDMSSIKSGIDSLGKTHEEAMTKLNGKGGIVRKTEQLRQLGIETKKRIPQANLDGSSRSEAAGEESLN